MNQYLYGICCYIGVSLRYTVQPTIDMMPISEADDPRNAYDTYDEEMVKIVPIIEPVHAANAT